MDRLLTGDELPQREGVTSRGAAWPVLEYRRLAVEREALRRVANLVATGAEPSEVFDAVTREMCRCVSASNAGLWRYDASGEITKLAGAEVPTALAKWAVGTRTRVDGNTLAAIVYSTGRPARLDGYDDATGAVAALVRETGVRSAVGVPVIVDGRVWGLAAVGSVHPGPMPEDTEARIGVFAELIAAAIVAGYRDEQKRQLLGGESQRPLLVDSLLYGRILDQWGVWEIANQLRLPSQGSFVVVAAEVSAVGTVPLPEIESKLRSLDVYSVWRVLPDLQVGIVHVKSEQHLDKILALLSRTTTDRVGVSARFDDLRDTPRAFHIAKVTLRNGARDANRVAVFDGSILATAAVSAPEAMVKSVATVLDGFNDLGEEERELLFETFRVWQDSDASVRDTAEVLICHPNTVRYRLRRIEQRTGRSLSRPRDIAELCLAFEVQRRLM
jgi:PucR C-terminal helix-turn-helix domain/GAF domain/GGDEF-like domain